MLGARGEGRRSTATAIGSVLRCAEPAVGAPPSSPPTLTQVAPSGSLARSSRRGEPLADSDRLWDGCIWLLDEPSPSAPGFGGYKPVRSCPRCAPRPCLPGPPPYPFGPGQAHALAHVVGGVLPHRATHLYPARASCCSVSAVEQESLLRCPPRAEPATPPIQDNESTMPEASPGGTPSQHRPVVTWPLWLRQRR